MQREMRGTVLSEGLCIGTVVKLPHKKNKDTREKIPADKVADECLKFKDIQETVYQKLQALIEKAEKTDDSAQAEILKGYVAILNDPELEADITEKIKTEHDSLPTALFLTANEYVEDMKSLEDEYLRQRADDFNELFSMLLFCTDPSSDRKTPLLVQKSVVAAHTLTPIDMAELDKNMLLGIVSQTGNKTSHAAIIARANGIPMLSGIPYDTVKNGDTVIIDGADLFINPDADKIQSANTKHTILQKEQQSLKTLISKPAVTLNGLRVELKANIGSPDELPKVKEQNADGIGLFRTEFILNENVQTAPSEDFQYGIYSSVLKAMNDKPVTIRTFDIGGDKQYPCFPIPPEENPFLGWRGIRYCLDNPDFFCTQLRALFRASTEGNLHIMFPMISTENEVKKILEFVGQVKADLDAKGIPYSTQVKLGIMIETPAAALIADKLAPLVDFFSIGSNDLTQYTLAVDRGNDKISALYQESHPAVLQLIRKVIETGIKHGKEVSVCGEMAGDSALTKKLLNLGLRCFSMTAVNIQKVKREILSANIEFAEKNNEEVQ
ncbi:phosphoenolpyruvate--protein phosphotransferase [Treponema sp. OMZ 840]|uniref:phosphoenolpyruvate--protein phosphotransferase n=1 Tax=Treponema sp. OMZ 840 TaxID=244313 RepID=UPI003D8F7229